MLFVLLGLAAAVYGYGVIVFVVNCSLERAETGRRASWTLAATAIAWPLIVLAVLSSTLRLTTR